MLFWLILAYFSGAIPFGKLFCLIGGVDIQKRGSGNIGYANVQRIMGWKYAVPTLLFDIAKGFIPTYLAYTHLDPVVAFWIGFTAIVGHIYPVWLKFKGGKGVATGLGILLVFAPIPALIGTIIYFALLHASHRSSLASIISATVALSGFVYMHPHFWWMALLLILTALFTLRQNFFGKVPDHG